MSKAITSGALLLLLLFGSVATFAAQDSAPKVDDKKAVAVVVRDAIDRVLKFLKNDELTPKEKREGVKGVIDSMIDLELLAKLSLGKTHWSKIDAKQRTSFTELFVETIRHSTYEKLELFTDELVEVAEPEAIKTSGSPKYKVVTWIVSKGKRTELSCMLAKRDDGWKVYDLEIEGVSIRKSYGSQYADFLREKSFDELLVQMREKVDEARKRMEEIDAKAPPPAEEQVR